MDTIPSPNPILNSTTFDYSRVETKSGLSNETLTLVRNANLDNITKSVDKDFADCGDTLTYTIVVPNRGNVTAQNVIYSDTIPNGTILVPNSVEVNGVTQPGENPQNGVSLGNISPGAVSTISFKVVIDCS